MIKNLGVAAIILLMFTMGCDQQDDERTVQIDNDSAALSERVSILDDPIALTDVQDELINGQRADFTIRHKATILPADYNQNSLNVSSVSYHPSSRLVAIGYYFDQEAYAGGVDLLQVTPYSDTVATLISHAQFSDSDVWDVHMGNQRVYLAQASDDERLTGGRNRATAEYLNVQHEQLTTEGSRIPLTGERARIITADTNRVFISSGTNGGATIFNSSLSAAVGSYYMQDSRGIDFSNQYVGVLIADTDGDNYGSVAIYNRQNYDFVRFIEFEGRMESEDTGTLQIIGEKVLVAAGTGGLKIFSIATGEQVAHIERPNPLRMGYGNMEVLTNTFHAAGDLIFVANKKGGVYVATTDQSIIRYGEGEPINITAYSRLEMPNLQEITQVYYSDNVLWITDKRDGTYILQLDR
jgi:hypothetical protein